MNFTPKPQSTVEHSSNQTKTPQTGKTPQLSNNLPQIPLEAADTSRFYLDGTGFIDFCEQFKYLGSIIHYSLTSDADVGKRIASATAAFGALKNIFTGKYLSEELKGEV